MAYSDFTARELMTKFSIKFTADNLFPEVSTLPPSDWLTEALKRGQELGFSSEKSRSERLVTPILMELSQLNHYAFAIHSGMNLDVEPKEGLNGECDFIFSFSRIQDFISAPIFCITEAKKQDLEQGTIQCAAQLIGASMFNQLEGNTHLTTLYGCSTTGIEWRFLTLQDKLITIDIRRYYITNLPKLLGLLQFVIEQANSVWQGSMRDDA